MSSTNEREVMSALKSSVVFKLEFTSLEAKYFMSLRRLISFISDSNNNYFFFLRVHLPLKKILGGTGGYEVS